MTPAQSANPLFYENHTNESAKKDKILFHAPGARRVAEAFHGILRQLPFSVPASQILKGAKLDGQFFSSAA